MTAGRVTGKKICIEGFSISGKLINRFLLSPALLRAGSYDGNSIGRNDEKIYTEQLNKIIPTKLILSTPQPNVGKCFEHFFRKHSPRFV